jgi:AcrR family transcriptional regulator
MAQTGGADTSSGSPVGPVSPVSPVRRRRDGEATRRRVLDAVVESVLDVGYYKASSNEIARRAGVTWGAIQHLFGSREALMLDVLDDGWARLHAAVANTEITGVTLEDRLREVLEVLASYYEQPSYIVQVQILLDLSKNPATSAETRAAIERHGQELSQAWQPLFEQALGGAAKANDLSTYAFTALRGYLASRVIASTITDMPADTHARELLVRGVAAAIRDDATARGLPLD